jgi:hypothetical protein
MQDILKFSGRFGVSIMFKGGHPYPLYLMSLSRCKFCNASPLNLYYVGSIFALKSISVYNDYETVALDVLSYKKSVRKYLRSDSYMTCKRLPHTISVGQYGDSGPYVPSLKGTVEGWNFHHSIHRYLG